MQKGYKCEYCDGFFADKKFAIKHENKCDRNPKNKVENKLITTIASIYEILPKIITSALCELNIDTDLYRNEVYRANERNCYYAIFKHKSKIYGNFLDIKSYSKKEKNTTKTSAEYWKDQMPKLHEAIKNMLNEVTENE